MPTKKLQNTNGNSTTYRQLILRLFAENGGCLEQDNEDSVWFNDT
jgi:hypothetical protein